MPLVGEYESYAEAILANAEFMEKGQGEGLICVGKHQSTKWKIGAYPNHTNDDIIRDFVHHIESDRDFLGEYSDKALEVFDVLKRVQGSRKQVGPPGSENDYIEAI